MSRLTFYWDVARYISVAQLPGGILRSFTYVDDEDVERHKASMMQWEGTRASIRFYKTLEAGHILKDAEHLVMCRDCERCQPSRPHLRQPGKQYECDLLGADGHWYVNPEQDGCTWGTKRTVPLCVSCHHQGSCEHEAVKPILCVDHRKRDAQ